MVIELPEDIGIKKIKEFYLNLKDLAGKDPEIIFDFKKVRNIDLSLAQIIISFGKELSSTGGNLKFISVSDNVSKQFSLTGIKRNL